MTGRLRASTGALAVAVVIVALVPVADQIATVRAQTGTSDTVPRTAWGQPDLQGVWDFRTLTPMERPDELAIVHRILTTWRAGGSYAGIAAQLNREHVASKRGGQWHASTVRAIVLRRDWYSNAQKGS